MKMNYKLFLIFFVIIFLSKGFSQISINPPVIFIDNNTRTGTITVFNQSQDSKEIEISLKYGYVDTDSTGNSVLIFNDTLTEKKYSIAPYTSIYPKKFILKPNQQQDVKFMVKNVINLTDGTYWTRIITTSSDVKKQIDTSNYKDSIRLALKFKFEFITALFFQKGKLNTSINIDSIETRSDSNNVVIGFYFGKSGNSPCMGKYKISIFNSDNDKIEEISDQISIYFNSKRYFVFKKDKFKPGNYKLIITLNDDFPVIPEENKVRFKEISKSFDFSL